MIDPTSRPGDTLLAVDPADMAGDAHLVFIGRNVGSIIAQSTRLAGGISKY